MREKPPVLLFAAALLLPAVLSADWVEQSVRYDIDGTPFEGTVVYQSGDEVRPAVLMVPNWLGPTPASLEKAKSIAGDDYVVMMVDMYGTAVRPANAGEAGEAAGAVRGDRELMRARSARALAELRGLAGEVPLDPERVAAIGFCFGGGTVLELGRSGAEVDAIVSFHGDLASPTLASDAGATRARVLVLHGADDPFVPQPDVQAFIEAMRATEVDWTLVQFSNTVHSFTDPDAAMEGQAEYDEQSAERAFEMMGDLFGEIWD